MCPAAAVPCRCHTRRRGRGQPKSWAADSARPAAAQREVLTIAARPTAEEGRGWHGQGVGLASPVEAPAETGRPGGRALARAAIAFALALAAYLADVRMHPLHITFRFFDLNIYNHAGLLVRQAPAALYTWHFLPGVQYLYTPFAALGFAAGSPLPSVLVADRPSMSAGPQRRRVLAPRGVVGETAPARGRSPYCQRTAWPAVWWS